MIEITFAMYLLLFGGFDGGTFQPVEYPPQTNQCTTSSGAVVTNGSTINSNTMIVCPTGGGVGYGNNP